MPGIECIIWMTTRDSSRLWQLRQAERVHHFFAHLHLNSVVTALGNGLDEETGRLSSRTLHSGPSLHCRRARLCFGGEVVGTLLRPNIRPRP